MRGKVCEETQEEVEDVDKRNGKEIESERPDRGGKGKEKGKKEEEIGRETTRNTLPAEIPFECDSPGESRDFPHPAHRATLRYQGLELRGGWAWPGGRSLGLVSGVFVLESLVSVPPSAANNPEPSHATRPPTTASNRVHTATPRPYTYTGTTSA